MPRKAKKNPNGAGGVYWSESERRFVGAYTLQNGARRRLCGNRGDSSEKTRLLIQERLNAKIGQRAAPKGLDRLGPYGAHWLEHADYLRANTKATYRWAFDHYISGSAIAKMRLDDIGRTDIKAFFSQIEPVRGKTVGLDTKGKVRTVLHRIFQEAVEDEIITRNPVSGIQLEQAQRSTVALTPEEALFFLRHAKGHRLYAMFLLALTTTMGPAELFGLRKSDLHLKGGYLAVTQDLEEVAGHISFGDTKTTARRRRIELSEIAVEALYAHLKANMNGGEYVFTAPEGGNIRRNNFRKREWLPLIEKVATQAEKEAAESGDTAYRFPRVRFYALRHTSNALMGYLGVPIQVAKERMGHSSIRTTLDVYGHMYESMQKDAAKRFDEFLAPLRKTE